MDLFTLTGASENVIQLEPRLNGERRTPPPRVYSERTVHGKGIIMRDARESDTAAIQDLYRVVYHGKYPEDFAINPDTLRSEIREFRSSLWLVAEDAATRAIVGTIVFRVEPDHRIGKAAGVAVLKGYRSAGLASSLLKLGVETLTSPSRGSLDVDVIYATTRTITEAPSKVVAEVGFRQMGIFPNAVRVDNLEHLNLDVYVTDRGLALRRKKPFIYPPLLEVYQIARKELGLERGRLAAEHPVPVVGSDLVPLEFSSHQDVAVERYHRLLKEGRLANSFFPFHAPNCLLKSLDGGTEVFVCFGGVGKQSCIVGYRTDRVNVHSLLNSVALELQRAGAGYVELLVDAHDHQLQREAFSARYLPSAYFPALKLNADGLRDDCFVLSRTFYLLDFTGSVLRGNGLKFLRAYLRYYHDLYIRPILATDEELIP